MPRSIIPQSRTSISYLTSQQYFRPVVSPQREAIIYKYTCSQSLYIFGILRGSTK